MVTAIVDGKKLMWNGTEWVDEGSEARKDSQNGLTFLELCIVLVFLTVSFFAVSGGLNL